MQQRLELTYVAVNVVTLYVFYTTDRVRVRLLLDPADYISQRTIIILTRDSTAPAFCLNISLYHFSYCNATRELTVGRHGPRQRGYFIRLGYVAGNFKRGGRQHK